MDKATNRQVKAAVKLFSHFINQQRTYALPYATRRYVRGSGKTYTINRVLLRGLDKGEMDRLLHALRAAL